MNFNETTYRNESACSLNLRNRQLVFGPSTTFLGPRPPNEYELYCTNIPSNLEYTKFFQWLNRCGKVYEIRIMMKTNETIDTNETRGYCFVRFFEERSTIVAYELLGFLFLNGKRPNVQGSQCKRLLYAGAIPKNLTVKDAREGFQKILPAMTKCVVYPSNELSNASGNRGFAFLEFDDHDAALDAKRLLKRNTIWGRLIKIDWAKPTKESENACPRLRSAVGLRKNDYCAKLRLYALANGWCIPIIVYGNNFRQHYVQYGAVLLKNAAGQYSSIIIEIAGMTRVFDVHLILCEVATHLVEVLCDLPQKHYLVRARNGITAKILFSSESLDQLLQFTFASNYVVHPASVAELMQSLVILAAHESSAILEYYKLSFRTEQSAIGGLATFNLKYKDRIVHFCSIYPKFRNNYPLNNNLNDTEIILLLATAKSSNECCMTPANFNRLFAPCAPDEGAFVLKSQRYNRNGNYIFDYADVEMLSHGTFYHPAQKFNTPPLWICGESYQNCIYHVT